MSRFTPGLVLLAVGALVASVAGCSADTVAAPTTATSPSASATPSATAPFPLTVDNCGTEVVIDRAPERVVAIKSTSIELLLALGLGDRIVGTAFPDGPFADAWAAEGQGLEVISDKLPNQETVLGLEPDLVLAGWESNLSAEGAGERPALHALGVQTYVSPAACQEAEYQPDPLTWAELWREIEEVGAIFDVPQAAADLVAEQQARLAQIAPDERGLTALWWSSGGDNPYVGGGIGAPQMIMDAVGLTNVAAGEHATWLSYGWESVAVTDPDVIVVVDSTWSPAEKKITQIEANPVTAQLTAVREHRYLVVPFPTGEAGVRNVEAVTLLAEQLAALQVP